MLHSDAGYWSDQGDRENNEDCAEVLQGGRVCLVADGMGGLAGVEVASRLAVEAVQHSIDDYMPEEATEEVVFPWLGDIFAAVNQRILVAGQEDPGLQEMGTTLTLGLIQGDYLFFAHAGDSRLYLWRQGQCQQLTEDHTEAQEFVRRGWLSEEEARHSSYQHILTRWLGTIRQLEPQFGVHRLRDGDRLLLCSDGLSNEIDSSRLDRFLGTEGSPRELARQLVEEVMKSDHGRLDNITALVVRVDE